MTYDICTVTQIASLFHDFSSNEYSTGNNNVMSQTPLNKQFKKRSKALILASNKPESLTLQKQLGIKNENTMIDSYEHEIGKKIDQRNDKLLSLSFNVQGKDIIVYGRIDGFISDGCIVVEHKRRMKGLLNKVPYHECVQCHFYMKMMNSNISHLVETFGVHRNVHIIKFDESIWNDIMMRWFISSDFI